MPQITQLPLIFWSQLFWLLVIFGTLFFVIGRGMVPKIQATVEQRDKKIADDLARAQAARVEAESTEGEYRQRIEASRAEAMKLALAAKQAGAAEAEERTRALDAETAKKTEKAKERIRKSVDKAMAELETVASDAARELFEKLTGEKVGADDAREAVKASVNG